MPAIPTRSPWDFSDALQLLHTPISEDELLLIPEDAASVKFESTKRQSVRLGDFSRLWEAIGLTPDATDSESHISDFGIGQLHKDSTIVTNGLIPNPNQPPALPLRDDTYASDGGYHSTRKNVTWKDEPEYMDATDVPTTPTSEEGPPFSHLTSINNATTNNSQERRPSKSQKKKAKRQSQKLKKFVEYQQQELDTRRRKVTSDVESESEIRQLVKPTPASKASKHILTPPSRTLLRRADTSGQSVQLESREEAQTTGTTAATSNNVEGAKKKRVKPKEIGPLSSAPATPKKSTNPQHSASSSGLLPTAIPQQPDSTPTQHLSKSPQSQFMNSKPAHGPIVASPRTKLAHQKFQILDKEERDLQLFLRLIHEFSEDKKWLTRPVPMANHNSSLDGIHVFVDFSNIWIGLMDHLKNLQIKMRHRIPHQNISFDALVLLLERKRPVAKRVLAGSYPLMPAMELAQQIGYETAILEKVYKSREPTERQRRMLALQSRNSFAALGTQGSPNTPSLTTATLSTSPPTNTTSTLLPSAPLTPTPAPEKWVEQGVDEILHLKILESIVDSDVPSRMVVATGDAAKAEYSEGFMKMIVRALKKGWYVELVAFSKSISGEYRSAEFLNTWRGQFRIIMLDDWAQYLLDT